MAVVHPLSGSEWCHGALKTRDEQAGDCWPELWRLHPDKQNISFLLAKEIRGKKKKHKYFSILPVVPCAPSLASCVWAAPPEACRDCLLFHTSTSSSCLSPLLAPAPKPSFFLESNANCVCVGRTAWLTYQLQRFPLLLLWCRHT